MKFLSLQLEGFGLDFSDLGLRVVKLKKRGRFLSLASWKELGINKGIIEQGEIQQEEKLINYIKEAIKEVNGDKIRTKYVVASLPEKKAFLQVIRVPKMKQEELASAIPFEAENYIPLPIEDVYLDFQMIPLTSNNSDHFDILIAALPRETIDPYIYCLKKAGLVPKALEVESQSIVRALIEKGLSPAPLFIIDFGRSTSSFIIFSGNSLRFTSSAPFNSQKITEALAKEFKLNSEEAEKLKIKYGLGGSKKDPKSKKVEKIIAPLLSELTKEARKYIDYYQSHAKIPASVGGSEIKKVLLCGRGANLKGLASFISSKLKIPVEHANPWVNILPKSIKKVPKLEFKESLGYTTVLGLALRGIQE